MLLFVNMESWFSFSNQIAPRDAPIVRGLKKMTKTKKKKGLCKLFLLLSLQKKNK